eukprot:g60967.t1
MRSALRPRRTRTSKNWRRASPPGSRMLCGFCMRGRATCHGSGCNRGCSLQQQPCVPLFLDALTLERQRTRLHLRLYRHRYAEQLLNWWRREDADWNVASCAIDARDDRTLEALAERHPQLKRHQTLRLRALRVGVPGFRAEGGVSGASRGPRRLSDFLAGPRRWANSLVQPGARALGRLAPRMADLCVGLDWFLLGPSFFWGG